MAGITSLPLFHRIAGQKVLVLGDGEIAEPKKRLVERAGGIIEDDMQRAIKLRLKRSWYITCPAAEIIHR